MSHIVPELRPLTSLTWKPLVSGGGNLISDIVEYVLGNRVKVGLRVWCLKTAVVFINLVACVNLVNGLRDMCS